MMVQEIKQQPYTTQSPTSHSLTANNPTAALLIIGNEILSGRTVDQNINFLAVELNRLNIPVVEVRIVRDEMDAIVEAVRALSQAYTYVFTTGGIGPTHDDITWEAVAIAFDRPVVEHPEAYRRLKEHYGDALNESRRSMALMPEGAELIDNPVSAAAGCRIENVYVMAGIPNLMQMMFKSLEGKLIGGDPIYTESVVFHTAESLIATQLNKLQQDYPMVEIGSYPCFKDNIHSTTVVARSRDEKALKEVVAGLKAI